MGSYFSLYTAEIKTLYFVFNCFAEDLFKLISNKFRMVCKVDGNLQLDARDWSMYSRILKVIYFCVGTELRTKENFPVTWHKNYVPTCIIHNIDVSKALA